MFKFLDEEILINVEFTSSDTDRMIQYKITKVGGSQSVNEEIYSGITYIPAYTNAKEFDITDIVKNRKWNPNKSVNGKQWFNKTYDSQVFDTNAIDGIAESYYITLFFDGTTIVSEQVDVMLAYRYPNRNYNYEKGIGTNFTGSFKNNLLQGLHNEDIIVDGSKETIKVPYLIPHYPDNRSDNYFMVPSIFYGSRVGGQTMYLKLNNSLYYMNKEISSARPSMTYFWNLHWLDNQINDRIPYNNESNV